MSTASLEVSGLAYAYPDGHQALFGVDFRVGRGERVALLGPNGAGKTTLVLHLNGILSGGAGSVTVAGLPVGKRHMAEIRQKVGIVFISHNLVDIFAVADRILVLRRGIAAGERRTAETDHDEIVRLMIGAEPAAA